MAQMSFHSDVTFNRPRNRNLRMPRASFDLPEYWFDGGFSEEHSALSPFLAGQEPFSCGLLPRYESAPGWQRRSRWL